MKKLTRGIGVNDSDYPVTHVINGKRVECKFYRTWADMLKRCYCPKFHAKQPTYIGCSVAEEWHSFTAFKHWMERQNWQGKHLDKDILIEGNKIYSPENCVFVDKSTNNLLCDNKATRGKYPQGVYWHKFANSYQALCNTGDGKRKYLGIFDTVEEAEAAYKKAKAAVIATVAVRQTDFRVYEALMVRAVGLNLA